MPLPQMGSKENMEVIDGQKVAHQGTVFYGRGSERAGTFEARAQKSSSVSEAAIIKLLLSIIDFYLIHLDICIFKSCINCTI